MRWSTGIRTNCSLYPAYRHPRRNFAEISMKGKPQEKLGHFHLIIYGICWINARVVLAGMRWHKKRGAPSSLVKQKGGWKKVEEKVNKQWTKNNEKIQMKKMTSGCFVLLWWLQMIVPTGTVVSAVVITNVTNINETKQSHNRQNMILFSFWVNCSNVDMKCFSKKKKHNWVSLNITSYSWFYFSLSQTDPYGTLGNLLLPWCKKT